MTEWDKRFMQMAQLVASWSKDPSTKVGAVLVGEDRSILSTGFNGLPRGVADLQQRLEDRPTKYSMTVHAEVNCIIQAPKLKGTETLYVYPLFCCSACAGVVIQSGIRKVVFPAGAVDNERWTDSFNLASEMFKEANVTMEFIDVGEVDAQQGCPAAQTAGCGCC
jgi:dCMP deaminase